MITLEFLIQLIALGVVVGFFAGLLGIGGGGIFVPLLTSFFISQQIEAQYVVHLALGTSMTTIVATSLSSLLAHHKNANVIWPIVKTLSPAIIIGAFLATFIVTFVNSQMLAIFFTAFMAFIAYKMLIGGKQSTTTSTPQAVSVVPALGIGGVSTLVAIGGGSLTVPYLTKLGHDIKKAIGTSAAIGFPLAIAGSLGYLINGWGININGSFSDSGIAGFIHLPSVAILSICGFLTAPIGANLANKLPTPILKKIFAVLMLVLSVKMLFTVL